MSGAHCGEGGSGFHAGLRLAAWQCRGAPTPKPALRVRTADTSPQSRTAGFQSANHR